MTKQNRGGTTIDSETQKLVAPPRLVRTPPIKLDTLRSIRDELGRLYRESRCGKLPTQDASRLAFMLVQLKEMYLAVEIEERVSQLERNSK